MARVTLELVPMPTLGVLLLIVELIGFGVMVWGMRLLARRVHAHEEGLRLAGRPADPPRKHLRAVSMPTRVRMWIGEVRRSFQLYPGASIGLAALMGALSVLALVVVLAEGVPMTTTDGESDARGPADPTIITMPPDAGAPTATMTISGPTIVVTVTRPPTTSTLAAQAMQPDLPSTRLNPGDVRQSGSAQPESPRADPSVAGGPQPSVSDDPPTVLTSTAPPVTPTDVTIATEPHP